MRAARANTKRAKAAASLAVGAVLGLGYLVSANTVLAEEAAERPAASAASKAKAQQAAALAGDGGKEAGANNATREPASGQQQAPAGADAAGAAQMPGADKKPGAADDKRGPTLTPAPAKGGPATSKSDAAPSADSGDAKNTDDGADGDEQHSKHDKNSRRGMFAPVGASRLGVKAPCPVQSLEEVQVLLRLRERHTVLLARESAVAQREAALQKFEGNLRERVSHLNVALAKVEAQLAVGAAGDKAKQDRLQSLSDTIASLSAKKAAPMLAQAEPELVAELFRRLGPARTSSLLAVMPPAKAGKLLDYAAAEPKSVMSHASSP